MAFGERERSSLFAFARTRLLAKQAIRVIRLSGKLYGREGKKKTIAGRGKKWILAPRSCSQNIFGEGEKGKGQRKGSRDRSTYLRGTGDSRDKTSDKSKIKGGKKQHVILDTNDFCAKTRRCRKATRERRFIISIRVTRLPIDHVFHFGGEIRKARILFTI